MKKILIISFLLIFIVSNGYSKSKVNGEILFIVDLSRSYSQKYDSSIRYLSYILKKSKGKRFDHTKPSKKVSIITIREKSDLIAQRTLYSTRDVNALVAKYKKSLADGYNGNSHISDAFYVAQEIAEESPTPTLLIAFTDLEEGNFNHTLQNVSNTLPDFTQVIIVGVEKDRRRWKRSLQQKQVGNTKFIHINAEIQSEINEAFQNVFNE